MVVVQERHGSTSSIDADCGTGSEKVHVMAFQGDPERSRVNSDDQLEVDEV